MESEVALVKCADYSADYVEQAIRQAVGLLGGIEKFIKPGSRVLVKPNLLAAKEPDSGIVTHPQIVRAVIRILKDINVRIYLGDSPSVWVDESMDEEFLWEKTGMKRVAEEEGAELVKFNRSRWHGRFPLTTCLDETDYFISLPKFKTHDLTILTGAIKNLFGLIPGRYKVELHKMHFAPRLFARMLVDLYETVQPALTIVDGITALEGEGPASRGKTRSLGLIAAGVDCVGIDSILASVMGLKPEDILTTQEAAKRKLGNARIQNIPIRGEGLSAFAGEPFKLPVTTFKYRIPGPVIELIKKLVRFYPYVDAGLCSGCGACVSVCPVNVIDRKDGKATVDYSGCIACFCCQEACPEGAISVNRSFIARLIKL
ncbi:MAG: DUF362 domain-containing protein [Candidatus Omnitrophota bacterium]